MVFWENSEESDDSTHSLTFGHVLEFVNNLTSVERVGTGGTKYRKLDPPAQNTFEN